MNGLLEKAKLQFAHDATVIAGIENGSLRVIPLTQGKVAVIDAADYDRLNIFNWHSENGRKTMYAKRNTWENGRAGTLFMHRQVLGLKKGDGFIVDHIDQDGLNNQQKNLRVVTHAENISNSALSKKNKSGVKGISFCKQTNKWAVRLLGKWGGRFVTKEEATEAVRRIYAPM